MSLTKVEPSLTPLQAIGASARYLRLARKWPWAWWCTSCDDAYGAGKTRAAALAAAQQHETTTHNPKGI